MNVHVSLTLRLIGSLLFGKFSRHLPSDLFATAGTLETFRRGGVGVFLHSTPSYSLTAFYMMYTRQLEINVKSVAVKINLCIWFLKGAYTSVICVDSPAYFFSSINPRGNRQAG